MKIRKNLQKSCAAGVRPFFGDDQENHAKTMGRWSEDLFFLGHLKIHAKTTTVPILCLKNIVTLVKSQNQKT